jgi:hypothetical protein
MDRKTDGQTDRQNTLTHLAVPCHRIQHPYWSANTCTHIMVYAKAIHLSCLTNIISFLESELLPERSPSVVKLH